MNVPYSVVARPGLGATIEQPQPTPGTTHCDLHNFLTD